MFHLGLTGSIATGKSTVLKMFAARDIPIYSADDAVHALYQNEAVAPVAALFPGTNVDGHIDRAILAQKLIDNPQRLAELEAIVHPLVREKMLAFLQKAAEDGVDLAILEIPLLFETGADYTLDAIAVTTCADAEQRRRALSRPGMSVEKLQTMLARQMPQAEKKARADFVIDTGTSLEDTEAEVDKIIATCRKRNAKNSP